MRKLPRKFYNRYAIDVSVDLLGCHLISTTRGVKTGGKIVEVEAYIGEDDPACHAYNGPTRRNVILYGRPGFLYVYFTYGNHHLLNVVAEREGFPAAILIRAFEPIYNIPEMCDRRGTDDITNLASGPGKSGEALCVTTKDYGADLCGSRIYVLGPPEKRPVILASPRIGIGNRAPEKLWRFIIADNPHVSSGSRYVRENTMPLLQAAKMGFSLK
jgi:DNA-3-methyladenine glycosylase